MVMEFITFVTEVRLNGHPQNQMLSKFRLDLLSCNCVLMEIRDESVSLRANSDFQHSYIGEPVDVEFSYNRLGKDFLSRFNSHSFHFSCAFILSDGLLPG